MKKVIIFLLVLAMALGGLGFAHAAVTASQDDLHIYPTLEVGDTAALEGLTASMTITCGGHLRWHTDYPFGGEARTEFVYDPGGYKPPSGSRSSSFDIGLAGGSSASTTGDFVLTGLDYAAMFRAVAATTPDGESLTMNLRMADYVEYYQPNMDVQYEDDRMVCDINVTLDGLITGGRWYESEGNFREFFQTFRFPVQEDQIMAVTITKNDAGQIQGYDLYPENGPELYFRGDVTAEGLWFIPVFQNEQGEPLPYESPEGHGIYFVPWKKVGTIRYSSGDKDQVLPDPDRARRVIPLPEDLIIADMQLDAEAGTVWMLTREDACYRLSIYDLNTGALLASPEVLPFDPENDSTWAHFDRVGSYILVMAQERIALVDAVTHALLLNAPDTDQFYTAEHFAPDHGALRFDGETLILVDSSRYWEDQSFWAAAWRQGELVCYGEYDCSLMRGNDHWYYREITLEGYPMELN